VEKTKPRLLVLLPRVPYPLDKGDKLRAFKQLEGLSNHFKIILVCLHVGHLNPKALDQLNPLCEDVKIIYLNRFSIVVRLFQNIWKKPPFQVSYYYSLAAQKEFDIIVERYLPQRFYVQLIRTAEYTKKYTIYEKTIDYMDALSLGMQRRLTSSSFFLKPWVSIEAKRLKRYEAEMFNHFEKRTIISEQDLQAIDHSNNQEIKVIANGIAEEYFEPISTEKQFEICFTGNMSYAPNVLASQYLVKEILPLIKSENISVLISGKSPKSAVKKLASKQVTVSGWVKDMRESYAKSKFFVAPMTIGSGLQNKLLEAMACGLPCITTSLANKALGATPNEEILIADSPQEFAQVIQQLIVNPNLQEEIGINGQKFVRKNYSWKYWNDELVKLLEKQ
jgi:glycosyltransferase involved in cell wall biosynthesis